MKMHDNPPAWLLPAGFEDLGPQRAAVLEQWRRELLDRFAVWGYEQVIPPMLEHLEGLLTGSAADLDLQTWKVLDQASGRLLGLRSDMTPQMARIDAQMARDDSPRRLCYAGTVLRAQPDALGGSRAPFQVGAELFGVAGPEGDLEILSLMVETLQRYQQAGSDLLLDLGHMGLPLALVEAAGFTPPQRRACLRHYERKAWPDLLQLLQEAHVPETLYQYFHALTHLQGDRAVLTQARSLLASVPGALAALDGLEQVWEALHQRFSDLVIHCDLAAVQGHAYHTGMIFSIYGPQRGDALARGGRYDGVGLAYGLGRPATGFSVDLRPLLREQGDQPSRPRVWAPAGDAPGLWSAIQTLRAQGYVVVQGSESTGSGTRVSTRLQTPPTGFDAVLAQEEDAWQLSGASPDLPFPSF